MNFTVGLSICLLFVAVLGQYQPPRSNRPKVRDFFFTPNAPSPGGPYSQAVVARGKWVFISGQQGIEPRSDQIVKGGAEAEAFQALKNIIAIVTEVGGSKLHIVKMTNYLQNMAELAEVNRAYERVFTKGNYPARATFQVAALPGEGKLEIDAIAIIDN